MQSMHESKLPLGGSCVFWSLDTASHEFRWQDGYPPSTPEAYIGKISFGKMAHPRGMSWNDTHSNRPAVRGKRPAESPSRFEQEAEVCGCEHPAAVEAD